MEKQENKKMKILRSDRGCKYMFKVFEAYLKFKDITRLLTQPQTSQKNGNSNQRNIKS